MNAYLPVIIGNIEIPVNPCRSPVLVAAWVRGFGSLFFCSLQTPNAVYIVCTYRLNYYQMMLLLLA